MDVGTFVSYVSESFKMNVLIRVLTVSQPKSNQTKIREKSFNNFQSHIYTLLQNHLHDTFQHRSLLFQTMLHLLILEKKKNNSSIHIHPKKMKILSTTICKTVHAYSIC